VQKFSRLGLILYLLTGLVAILLLLTLVQSSKKVTLFSPLPSYLTNFENRQVSTIDIWTPILEYFEGEILPPPLTAKSALLYDLTNKKALYNKNSKEKLPMASLTKIMTAIIALENRKEDDKYIVKKEHLVGENSMGIEAGEVLSLEELLYGLILNSGNDAGEVIANNFEGGRTEFIKAMNQKAKSLGLSNTNFTNPSGLEGDGEQYSTTFDLLIMTNFALTNFPEFRKTVATVEYNIPKTTTHKAYYLYNETSLLTTYPGVKGVKLGFTPEAGYSMITYLEYKGFRILGILLNSQNRREEMKSLLDHGLKLLGVEPPPHS